MADKEQSLFCIKQTDGYVYPFTEALGRQGDMLVFRGTLEQAKAKGIEVSQLRSELAPTVLTRTERIEQAKVDMSVESVEAEPDLEIDDTPPVVDPFRHSNQRIADIAAAIKQLEPGNHEHFTKSGPPRVEAIELVLGDDITMAERDQAWAELKEYAWEALNPSD